MKMKSHVKAGPVVSNAYIHRDDFDSVDYTVHYPTRPIAGACGGTGSPTGQPAGLRCPRGTRP